MFHKNRRMAIEDQYMFECKCKRCQDPTELQTYFGGIYCLKCNNFTLDNEPVELKGVLYQERPLDEESPWKCTHCASTSSGEECQGVLKMLNDNIHEVLANSPGSTQVMELVSRRCIFK